LIKIEMVYIDYRMPMDVENTLFVSSRWLERN